MKLTKQERKYHHKLSKWQHRNDLSFAEQRIVRELSHQIGKTNVSINLEQISDKWACERMQWLKIDFADNSSEFKTAAHEEFITGFERLQNLGFIEVISFENKKHIVKVIPVWE